MLILETPISMTQPITAQMKAKRFPKIKRTEIERKKSAKRNTEKSDSSVEVWRGSEADLNYTQESVSTIESDTEEAFVVESHQKENSEDYYEEPDSSREMPELTRAPVLADITNKKRIRPPVKDREVERPR